MMTYHHLMSCLVPEQVISNQPLNPQLFFSSRAHALFSLPAATLERSSSSSWPRPEGLPARPPGGLLLLLHGPSPPARFFSVPSNVTSRYENFLDQILPMGTSNSQCKMKEYKYITQNRACEMESYVLIHFERRAYCKSASRT